MLANGWAGVNLTDRLQVDAHHAVSDLTGPLPWWGTLSDGTCSYTGPKSSTLCTVCWRCGICTLYQTKPGGSGRVMVAATAPLDQIVDLSTRQTTYRRTYTKPPEEFLPSFFTLLMTRPLSDSLTHRQP